MGVRTIMSAGVVCALLACDAPGPADTPPGPVPPDEAPSSPAPPTETPPRPGPPAETLRSAIPVATMPPNQVPAPATPPPATRLQVGSAAAPATALLAVRLSLAGGVSVGAVHPKPIPWRDPLRPYEAPTFAADPAGGDEQLRPGTHRPMAPPSAHDAAQLELLLVTRPPGGAPVAHPLLLAAPGHVHGDVVDPWTTGGAVWRAPWFGEGTAYEVVRAAPDPTVLARWP